MPQGGIIKLTMARHKAIIKDLQSGIYPAQVAVKNGICRQTLQNWVARGLAENAEEPFLSFAKDYLQTDIAIEQATIQRIREAAEPFSEQRSKDGTTLRRGDWRADAWYAEKRWPKRYGPKAELRTDGGDDLQLPQLLEGAQSRPNDIKDLLLNPPQELEDILLDPEVRESLLRRLKALPE